MVTSRPVEARARPGHRARRAPVAPTGRARRGVTIVLALAATAAGGALVGARLRARPAGRRGAPAAGADLSGLGVAGTGVVGRNLRLARLGARTVGAHTWHRARRTFLAAERREELDREHQLRTAAEVAAELGQMKGALMKLGQMLSYLDDGLPEPLREALTALQHDAPPMSPDLAAEVVCATLGEPPERRFATWDPTPIAAASIGQVHRAITHDGRAVAVKVQYPGVAEAMTADLANVALLFRGLGQVFPGLEVGPLVEELRVRLREELDYRLEAEHQDRFARYYEGHPFIHVPRVLHDHSGPAVLTTELATGARFAEVETWSQHERNLAGETIFRFTFGGIYRLGMFNGDPHPGNYLFRGGGRVTFLDFGLVKRFRPQEIRLVRRLIDTMVLHPQPAEFRRAMEEVGFLRAGAAVDDEAVFEYFRHFYAHVLDDAPFRFDAGFARESVRRFFDQSGPYRDVMRAANVPAGFAIVQRINLGLFAVLARLGSEANWRRIAAEIWPWVAAGPSTPLGRAEARWRRARPGGAEEAAALTGPGGAVPAVGPEASGTPTTGGGTRADR